MKDQRKLLNSCIKNDIPAVVFQGTDSCALEILIAAKEIYTKNGCSKEFLFDWQLLINEFSGYQQENVADVKLAKLSTGELEDIKTVMDLDSF